MFPLSGGRCEAGPLGRREDVAAQVSLQDEIRRLGPDTDQLNMQRGPVNIFKVPWGYGVSVNSLSFKK